MDYDACITKTDGALLSLSKRGYLNSPDHIPNVVDTLHEIVQNFTGNEKRKVVFFMILNTELSVSERLLEDENLGLFIRTPAYLNKNFFVDYMYELNLQDYVNSAIASCPCAMTVELIRCIMEKLKKPEFHRDKYGIKHMYDLWEAVFVKIWRIENENGADNTQELIFCFEELFNLIQKVLTTSMTIQQDDLIEFISKHLYYFFNSLRSFVKLFTNQTKIQEIENIYNLTVNLCGSGGMKNPSEKCFEIVFTKLQDILNFLTFDIWMNLLEVELQSKSAQELVGNCIYEICEVHNIINIPADVLTCLSALKIKPKTEEDEIAEANLEEIIQKVDEGKKVWFKALIQNTKFCTEDSLKCVLRNLNLASHEDVEVILDALLKHLPNSGDLMQELFFSTLKLLPEKDYEFWTNKTHKICQGSTIHTCKSKDEIIETFNKFSSEGDVSTLDLLCLFIQLPLEIITKICTITVDDAKQIDFCTELLKKLCKNAPKFFYSTIDNQSMMNFVMLKLIQTDLKDRQQQALIEFVSKLANEKLLDDTFLYTLLDVIRDSLQNEKLEKAVLCLKISKPLLEQDMFLYNKPAVLVFLSQILGHLSWDLKTFSTIRADGVDVVSEIVFSIVQKLKNDGDELEWARNKILKSSEVNQAIFCDLWFQFSRKWLGSEKLHSCILALAHSNYTDSLLEVLGRLEDLSEIRTSIIMSFFMVLPVISFRNWLRIFDHLVCFKPNSMNVLDVLDMFGSAMYLLTLNVQVQPEVYFCYKYCLRNFGRLVKHTTPKLKNDGLFRTIERLTFLLNAITSQKEMEDCIVILSPVIYELIDRLKKTDGLVEFREKIEEALRVVDEKNAGSGVKLLDKL